MFLSPETLTELISLGAPPEKLARVLHMIERDAESVRPRRSSGAERQARYEERQRQKASESVSQTSETSEPDAAPPPLFPSPHTPQPITPPPGDISSRARKGRPGDPVGFDDFWAIYPNRAARKDAVRAFTKALDAIPDEDALAVILAGVRRALPGWEGTETRFIPHAASWLNAERWNDPEPPPRTITPTSPRNDRPDRFAAKQANYQSALAGADWADQVLVARRGF